VSCAIHRLLHVDVTDLGKPDATIQAWPPLIALSTSAVAAFMIIAQAVPRPTTRWVGLEEKLAPLMRDPTSTRTGIATQP